MDEQVKAFLQYLEDELKRCDDEQIIQLARCIERGGKKDGYDGLGWITRGYVIEDVLDKFKELFGISEPLT